MDAIENEKGNSPRVPKTSTGRRGILSVKLTAINAPTADTIELTRLSNSCIELEVYPMVLKMVALK